MAFTYKVKVGNGPAMTDAQEETFANVKMNFSTQQNLSYDQMSAGEGAATASSSSSLTLSIPDFTEVDSNPLGTIYKMMKRDVKQVYVTVSVLNNEDYIDLVSGCRLTNVWMYCNGQIVEDSNSISNELTINFIA